jgi:hypothetical protein
MKVRHLIQEGGWANAATQSVKLTPAVAKKALAHLPAFEKDFNEYLQHLHMMPIKLGKPVGSSAYIDKDIEGNPDKEYGDIDKLFVMPRLDGFKESKNDAVYREQLVNFLLTKTPRYIEKEPDTTGHHILVKTDVGPVQVDLVTSFYDVEDWTQHRMTPEHGLKGAFLGFLYASVADALNLSINTYGAQAKEIGGEIVPFKKIKVDAVHTVSTDIGNFMMDILEYFYKRGGGEGKPKVSPMLKKHPGMNREKILLSDLIASTKGLAHSFAMNDMFGKGDLKHLANFNEMMHAIKDEYRAKAVKSAAGSKFDKASTPSAIARAEETKNLLLTKSEEIIKQL